MRVLRVLETVAAVMLMVAVITLLTGKMLEHVAGMIKRHPAPEMYLAGTP